MKIKVNTDLERLQIKAREAIFFLEGHPALCAPHQTFLSSIWFSIETVCKRGYCEHAAKSVNVYKNSKEASRFKKEFEKELKNYTKEEAEMQGPLTSIDVPYRTLFGEDWKFDRVEYWGELGFYKFTGSPTFKKSMDLKNWQSWCGINGSGCSFEEMVIDVADKFRKKYGDFDKQDFLTKEEKENHKKEKIFFSKPCKDKKFCNCIEMVRNKKYKRVNDAQLNKRWQKWFATTPEGKRIL